MEKYIINLELPILYFDLIEIIELIKEHGSDELENYLQELQSIVDEHQNESDRISKGVPNSLII